MYRKYYTLMQNSSEKDRPLIYNPRHKAELHAFVHGNPSHQAYSLLVPSGPAPNIVPTTSLFDRYNRPLLFLRDVDPGDLQPLVRHLLLHEQPLSDQLAECISVQQALNKPKKPYPEKLIDRSAQPTREFLQNEALFNYQEVGELKRQQKREYLSQIEHMVAEAEKQIEDIEAIQQEEQLEVKHLQDHQARLQDQLSTNLKQGLIQQGETYAWSPRREAPPPRLHPEMQPREINAVLEEHFKLNEDLLERANLARKAPEKQKSLNSTQNPLGKTMRRAKGVHKQLASTNKGRFKH